MAPNLSSEKKEDQDTKISQGGVIARLRHQGVGGAAADRLPPVSALPPRLAASASDHRLLSQLRRRQAAA